jgi:hypothetical protein
MRPHFIGHRTIMVHISFSTHTRSSASLEMYIVQRVAIKWTGPILLLCMILVESIKMIHLQLLKRLLI